MTHICITHTHSDHSPASRALAAATGAPILGFGPHPAIDARRSGGAASEADEEPGDWDFVPDVRLAHGDVVAGDGWTLESLHTPGHISNHLCFGLASARGLFTGDHVMGWSSTIIPPPDGNLGDYLASLQLLIDRGDRDQVYWPTHGPPITSPGRFARRCWHTATAAPTQILGCLRDGAGHDPRQLVEPHLHRHARSFLHPCRRALRSGTPHPPHRAGQGHLPIPSATSAPTEYALA